MKVLKLKFDGKKVVFDSLPEAVEFMDALQIPLEETEISTVEMDEEDFKFLKDFEQ